MWLPEAVGRVAVALSVIGLLTGVAACGFQPVYGTQGATYAAQDVTAAIRIAPIKDRVGQRIRNELIRQLTPAGEPADAPYHMTLQVVVDERDVFTGTSREVDRATVLIDVSYQIVDAATIGADPKTPPTVIYTDKAFAESSFNRFPSEFANIRARLDAENRAAREVAVLVRNQIAAAVVAGNT